LIAGNIPPRAANKDRPFQNLANIAATYSRATAYRYTYHKEGGMLNLGIVELAAIGGLFLSVLFLITGVAAVVLRGRNE
jgi:hypothetical protein